MKEFLLVTLSYGHLDVLKKFEIVLAICELSKIDNEASNNF